LALIFEIFERIEIFNCAKLILNFPTNGSAHLFNVCIINPNAAERLQPTPSGSWLSTEIIMRTALNTTCYTVEATGQIVTGTLNDFEHHIETTTRPNGVGYKYYPTTIKRPIYDETGDLALCADGSPAHDDIWVLAKWATWGGPQVVVSEHDSEEAAQQAAEETYIHDILNNTEELIFLSLAKAEAYASQIKTDLAGE
jgi:hypothetical protein